MLATDLLCSTVLPYSDGAQVNYAALTGVDMNRDGIPDVLQQPQVCFAPQGVAALVQYGAPVNVGKALLRKCQEVIFSGW